jgi:hypothetical protein
MTDKPVPVFSSFGKPTNDFFTKGFPAAHKLELSTKAENGLTFINSAEKKARKDGSEYILGKFECKYKYEPYGLEITEAVDTDNVIKGEFSVNKLGLQGLKVIAKPQIGKAKEINAGFEFQNQQVSVASSLLFKADGETLLTAGFAGRRGLFSAGVETNYFLKKAEGPAGFDSVRGLLGYKTQNLEVLFTAKNQWNVENKESSLTLKSSNKLLFGASFEHKPGDKTTLHSQLDYDTTKPMPEAVALKFGGSHQLDADTSVQGKLDTEGKLGLHLSKQLCPSLKGTITSEFDVFALSGSEHKFALGLAYKP